ncbi:hypothetical protein V2J09_009236 [Rumex salicifolius]
MLCYLYVAPVQAVSGRCLLPAVITVAVFVMMHSNSLLHRSSSSSITNVHTVKRYKLEAVEEENIRIPSTRGRRESHHGASPKKKRGPRRISSLLVDEFLNENSQLRRIFFPDMKTAIDPRKQGNGRGCYYPGRIWLDTEGNPIQAHGGGILYDNRLSKYFWYGEYKDGPTFRAHKKGAARVDVMGVGCYSSKDLWSWKNEGIVLGAEKTNENHDLHVSKVLERPKVIYNERTGKYVMWMHIDDSNYTKASVGVALSDSPTGPFNYLYSRRPHGFDSRDMTVFKDEDDGVAYLIYSSEANTELHVGPLTEDYLEVAPVMRRVLVRQHREAPAVFKHEGTYYMLTSGCSGWSPNEVAAHAAVSMLGPWETLGNPCIGANKAFRETTFFSQSSFVLPVPGLPGYLIFMADRWNPADLRDSRYVWLPLTVGGAADLPRDDDFAFPMWSRLSIFWSNNWTLPSLFSG